MENNSKLYIKTICLCGHVDVGKSTFAGMLLSAGTYRSGEPICEDLSVCYAKQLDILGEFKQKGKGATRNYTCNQAMIDGQIYSIIDNPGHLEYVWQVARSLQLSDILVLICQADKLAVSLAYCRLIKYISKQFQNIQKTVLVVNKYDLNPGVDLQAIQKDIQVDMIITHSAQTPNIEIIKEIARAEAKTAEDNIIAFDQDSGGKDTVLYFKTLKAIDDASQIQYCGMNLCDIMSFSDKQASKQLLQGEYFVARLPKQQKKDNMQMGALHGQLLPNQFNIVGKINRAGVLFSIQRYIGYTNYQYFECLVKGPGTLKPQKCGDAIEIEVKIESQKLVHTDGKIVLFNRQNINNPIIFIGQVL